MEDFYERHDPVADCDFQECACSERNRLRDVLRSLLTYHQEGDDGAELPREYWSAPYRAAVEQAEAVLGHNVEVRGCGDE